MSSAARRICRGCSHSTWPESKTGRQIRQGATGQCSEQHHMLAMVKAALPPGMQVMPAAIRPTSNAKTCPRFTPRAKRGTRHTQSVIDVPK